MSYEERLSIMENTWKDLNDKFLELKERFDFKNEQAYNEHTSIRKHLNKTQEVLRELFQRMGDNEDLSVVGYDLLEKLGSEKKEFESEFDKDCKRWFKKKASDGEKDEECMGSNPQGVDREAWCLHEISSDSKPPEHKIITIKEACEELKKYSEKMKKEIKERNEKEYRDLEGIPPEPIYYDLPEGFEGFCYFDSMGCMVKLHEDFKLVKREDLKSLANLVKIHYSNDKRIPELNRIKEEYGIE